MIGIGPDHFRFIFCAVGQRDDDRISSIHHVKVGHHMALLVPDEARIRIPAARQKD